MNQANSPLELYEKAYRLQYEQNKIPEACRLYKAIIDEFPDSPECGYSVIQLEKLISGAVSEKIVVSSRNSTILAAVALAVSVLSLVGVIVAGMRYDKAVKTGLSNVSAVSHSIAVQEAAKADEEAAMKKAAAEEKPAADTSAAAKSLVQPEPAVHEKNESSPAVKDARTAKPKKEPPAAPKTPRHKAGVPASHPDSVSFF
jgi:hypothetical protein